MEMMLSSGFEEMKLEEMETIEGGDGGLLLGMAIGFLVDGIVLAVTDKSCAEWVETAVDYAGQKIVDTYRWTVAH